MLHAETGRCEAAHAALARAGKNTLRLLVEYAG